MSGYSYHRYLVFFRFWDVRTMAEFKTIETENPVSSMEINRDGTILIVTYGKEVSFWDTSRYLRLFSRKLNLFMLYNSLC